jgi:hypothetical protein
MAIAVEPQKKRAWKKYNWPPIEADMDRGLSSAELAAKYSVPIGSIEGRKRERRLKMAAMVQLQQSDGSGESGLSAPLPRKPAAVIQKTEVSAPSPSELTEDQLSSLFADPQSVLSLTPEALEKLAGRKYSLMLAEILQNPPEARTLKDLATVHKMFREANGLTGDKGKGGSGLLSPQRSYGRRMVEIEARVIEGPEEPEGGWPEGM